MDNSSTIMINSLIKIFCQTFATKNFHYQLHIDNTNPLAPITYRNKKEIILCCNLSSKYEFVFQLSHELCHSMIPCDVPKNLRWLEETFAVLASYVFPPYLSDIDASVYTDYFYEAFAQYEPLCADLKHFPDTGVFSTLASGLGTNNYNDYGSYWYVAQILSPCVSKQPDIWRAIPYLCDVPDKLSFEESLQSWENAAPLYIRNSISVIKSSLLKV